MRKLFSLIGSLGIGVPSAITGKKLDENDTSNKLGRYYENINDSLESLLKTNEKYSALNFNEINKIILSKNISKELLFEMKTLNCDLIKDYTINFDEINSSMNLYLVLSTNDKNDKQNNQQIIGIDQIEIIATNGFYCTNFINSKIR